MPFNKNHYAQYLSLKVIEIWKKHLDKRDKLGVIPEDLSKAFDAIHHSLLLAKLDAYGFPTTSSKFMQNYLFNRHQRSSINCSFSDWTAIITRVPQGSILGSVFMFILKCNLSNYFDDNTLYVSKKALNQIRKNIEIDFMIT